ncbi:MAG: mycothiol synthase [Sporichthyaceae bacterium]
MSQLEAIAGSLDGPARERIAELDAAVTAADGRSPWTEAGRLALAAGLPDVTHLLLSEHAGALLAYAQIDPAGTVELGVHPAHRRRGLGTAVLRAARTASPVPVRVWSHGMHPGAAPLAEAAGLVEIRELWRMRRPLPLEPEFDPPGPVALPPGVSVRAFIPGTDDAQWLRVNAAAFAQHGEQGRLGPADLAARIAAGWFDPSGFFLAFRGADLIGFHWTKEHAATEAEPAAGEIYVLGVDPGAHSGGLGRALSRIGLRHLAAAGLDSVLLYVDADNAAAIRVYTRLGFYTEATSVMYADSGPGQT